MLEAVVLAGVAMAMVLPGAASPVRERGAPGDPRGHAQRRVAEASTGGPALDGPNPFPEAANEKAAASATMPLDLARGVYDLDDFDPSDDRIRLHVPADAVDIRVVAGGTDCGTPPALCWSQQDGAVELRFSGLDAVPAGRIDMVLEALGQTVTLEDLLAPDPTLPQGENALPPRSATVPNAGQCVVPGRHQIIRDFDPAHDILSVAMAPGEKLTLGPSPDGTRILVDARLCAVVMGCHDLSSRHIVRRPARAEGVAGSPLASERGGPRRYSGNGNLSASPRI